LLTAKNNKAAMLWQQTFSGTVFFTFIPDCSDYDLFVAPILLANSKYYL
jgi:hypothetical protein